MWRGLRSDAHRPTSDEIARELRDHLELEAQEIGARGVDATTAAALAHRRFGNVTLALENVRAEWRVGWIDQLSRDVRHGLRGLRRSPVYTITAATTLALGIGASVAVFSLGYHVLERPFPLFPQDRLVWIVQRSPRQCPTCDKASPGAYEALREHTASLSAVGAAQLWRATLRGSGEEPSNLVHGYLVTANLFRFVAAPFALGRDFPTDADRPGRSGVAVLTYDFWQRRFHGSRGVLDSTIMLDGNPRRVVGVLARHVVFPTESQFYLPLVLTAADANEHASRYLDIFARLAPGATVAGAQREAAVLSARLATEYPRPNADWQLVPLPLRSFHTDGVALLVRIFAVAAALVLLAACVSVANLALARTSARRREVALRAALGGQRGRLVRTLLVEALLVAFAGGLIGVGLAAWGIHAAANIVPAELARYSPGMALTHVDGRALAFTVVMCVITAVMFAALPALRVTSAPLSSVLTDGGRSSAGDAHGARLRGALVVVEVSVALALLSAAVLLTRSVRNMMRGDPGVRLDHVLTTQLSLPRGTSDSAARVFITRLDERLRQERGIIQAGVVSTTPLSNNWWGTTFAIPGREAPPDGSPLVANDQRITPGYFEAMGIRILNGRGIETGDRAEHGALRAVVINQYMAEHLWPRVDPVGRTITIASQPWTIVGVSSDVRHGGLDSPMRFEIYRPAVQVPSTAMDLDAWVAGDLPHMRDRLRQAVAEVDPAAAVGEIISMREMDAQHVSPFRLMAGVVGTFALTAMLMAVVGVYGVIAYDVTQRRREMAIRMALGATAGRIVSHVAGRALRLALIGIVIGGAGGFAFAHLLRAVLYGVPAGDPVTPLAVAGLLLLASLAAALIPSWRASRWNPVISLND